MSFNGKISIVILFLFSLLFPGTLVFADEPSTGSDAGILRVRFENLRNSQGQLAILLFDQGQGFPGDQRRALRKAFLSLPKKDGDELVMVFRDLSAGNYAVSVFHDENSNRKLDKNLFGKPKEGIGTSRNPKFRFSAPKFDDAEFAFPEDGALLTIKLVYL